MLKAPANITMRRRWIVLSWGFTAPPTILFARDFFPTVPH